MDPIPMYGNERHGHYKDGKPSRTYASWQAMMNRCYREQDKSYARYGGAGIRVCDMWHLFEHFLSDMGERPPGLTLDRLDASKDYEPGNCRWATAREQAREKRRMITFQGVTLSVSDWARRLGVSRDTLSSRLNKKGWTVEQALTGVKS